MDFTYASDVEGYPSEAECRFLYDLACATPADGVIVEIGTYKGRSAIALAQSDRRVFCVDRFQPEPQGFHGHPDHHAGNFSARQVIDNAARYGVVPFVITGQSAAVGADWPDICGLPINLLFIDADHDFDGVKADFDAWSPYVAPDGVIVFDDSVWPGVQQLLLGLRDWVPVPGPQVGGMTAMRRAPALVEA